MYDRNGLELSPIQESLNAYKFTATNTKARNYSAYAQLTRNRGLYSMATIGKYKDARDAAFVGQAFAKVFNEQQAYEMVLDKTFEEVAADFVSKLEIPEWKYPAEGLDWDDIHGSNGCKNRVDNAKDALIEALKIMKKQTPALPKAKKMIEEVEALYQTGKSYRESAKIVCEKA